MKSSSGQQSNSALSFYIQISIHVQLDRNLR